VATEDRIEKEYLFLINRKKGYKSGRGGGKGRPGKGDNSSAVRKKKGGREKSDRVTRHSTQGKRSKRGREQREWGTKRHIPKVGEEHI